MKLRPVDLTKLARIRDGSGHSVFGPSGSGMWLNCPGSLIPNLLLPDLGTEDSAYGTVAHGLMEQWGKTGIKPVHLIGTNVAVDNDVWGWLIWIDEDMLEHCQACYDWIEWIEGEKLWERRVDFSRITPIPNQRGTADVIIVQLEQRRLIVVDWKFGQGVPVYAERNTQAMLYALGALWEMEEKYGVRFEEIEIRIGQPRRDNFDEWVTTRDELLQFAGWAQARMALAWNAHAPRVPGSKQCEFCKAKNDCAAYAKLSVELTEGVFENLDNPHPCTADEMREFKERLDEGFVLEAADAGTLTTEQLAKLKPYTRAVEKFWKRIPIELMKRHAAGEDLTEFGLKLVEGRSRRAFVSKGGTLEALMKAGVPREKVIVEEMISPAQAERELRAVGIARKDIPSLLEGLTKKPPGKPTLVPLSDKRDAMVDINEGVFDDLETETTEDEDY